MLNISFWAAALIFVIATTGFYLCIRALLNLGDKSSE